MKEVTEDEERFKGERRNYAELQLSQFLKILYWRTLSNSIINNGRKE